MNEAETTTTTIRTYRFRWYVLGVVCLGNAANGVNLVCFGSIANLAALFYSVSYAAVNFFSMTSLITVALLGLFGCLLVDLFGIRASIGAGVWLNFAGSLVELLSALCPVAAGFPVLVLGQAVCSVGQIFLTFVSAKFANAWFAEHERGLANSLALMANLLGALLGAVLAPQIVSGPDASAAAVGALSQMSLMLLIFSTFSFVPALLSLLVRRSLPPLPPSRSNASIVSSRLQNCDDNGAWYRVCWAYVRRLGAELVALARNWRFLVLAASFGVGLGVFNVVSTLIEQIICVRGYSNADAGYFPGALILAGLVGSVLAGLAMDRTKRYELLAKLCFGAIAIWNIAIVVLLNFDNDHGLVYGFLTFSFAMLGFFALPLLPVCFEAAVESTYPIAESTSTGLLFMAGQLTGIAMILVYPQLAATVSPDSVVFRTVQTCVPFSYSNITSYSFKSTLDVLNYQNPLYGQAGLLVLVAVLFAIFYKCPNLRLNSDK